MAGYNILPYLAVEGELLANIIMIPKVKITTKHAEGTATISNATKVNYSTIRAAYKFSF